MTRRVLGIAILLFVGCGAIAAQDLEVTLTALKTAEQQKDIDGIKKMALEAIINGKKAAEAAAPTADAEKATWKEEVEFATSVQSYGEYALLNAAMAAPVAQKLELFQALVEASPKSKYLDQGGYVSYFAALRESGASAKIGDIAEAQLANQPDSLDLLATATDAAFGKGQMDKANGYAVRLVSAVGKAEKAEGVTAADWEKKKDNMLGSGYYMQGMIAFQRNQWSPADKNLRSAIQYIGGDMRARALFGLGVANYNIGKATNNKQRILDGAKFSEDCAKIQSAVTDQAYRNALAMRDEAMKMR